MEKSSLDTWTSTIPLLRAGYHLEMLRKVASLPSQQAVFPPRDSTFYALEIIPFTAVRVVVLGQDPYHRPGQAHGLAFSVPEGVPAPPSLNNIFREVENDIGQAHSPPSPDLSRWARQGVLLLNSVLTVEEGKAHAHQGLGWEELTDQIVATLAREREHLVFLLWGGPARAKKRLVDPERHLILEAAHPSPLSAYRGFFGCRHFSRANRYLREHALRPIEW